MLPINTTLLDSCNQGMQCAGHTDEATLSTWQILPAAAWIFTILMKSGRHMRPLLRFPSRNHCQMQQKLVVLLVCPQATRCLRLTAMLSFESVFNPGSTFGWPVVLYSKADGHHGKAHGPRLRVLANGNRWNEANHNSSQPKGPTRERCQWVEANQKTMSGNPSVRKKTNLDTTKNNFWSIKIAKTVWQTTLDFKFMKPREASCAPAWLISRTTQMHMDGAAVPHKHQ